MNPGLLGPFAHRAEWERTVRQAPPILMVNGIRCLTRRDDVVAAATQPETFARPPIAILGEIGLPMVPLSCPPAEHGRYRQALRPLFSPSAVDELLPALHEHAAALVGAVAAKGECDAMADIATLYPAQALLTFLGFPLADRDRLIAMRAAVRRTCELRNLGEDTDFAPTGDLLAYVSERVIAEATDERRGHRGGRTLSQLLAGPFSYPDVLGFYTLLMIAGLDNPAAAIGFALLELARNPQLRAQLREHPKQMAPFVDEIVRLEPPVTSVARVTTEPVAIGGETLPAGTRLSLLLQPAGMEGGAEISIEGGKVRRKQSFSFGVGPRHCLGIHLARLELQVILTEWLRRIPDFALKPGFGPDALTFTEGTNKLDALPLRWEAK